MRLEPLVAEDQEECSRITGAIPANYCGKLVKVSGPQVSISLQKSRVPTSLEVIRCCTPRVYLPSAVPRQGGMVMSWE
jgi:hypothetical protein